MKPILILQHLSGDGPGYFGRWLQRQGLAADVRNTEAGDAYPRHLDDHAALALLGGEMSANDALPSLRQAEALIREAVLRQRPVIGHCLGGQLMARALGARVAASPAPEIGWQAIERLPTATASDWLGPASQSTVFQWHYEAFELPLGAESLACSAACPHQAFVLGPHLAMQFHIEIDADKVQRWSAEEGPRWLQARAAHPATVQDGPALRGALAARLPGHQQLADRVYGRWLQGLAAR